MSVNCPACTGTIEFESEETDDGGADVYGPRSYTVYFINDAESEHMLECTLSDSQREDIENERNREPEPYDQYA